MLAEGTDITLQANTDITLNGAISVPTSNSSTLTLLAGEVSPKSKYYNQQWEFSFKSQYGFSLGTADSKRLWGGKYHK